jgi:phosphoribosyl 1,2-cyclic phosphodiesterase
MLNGCDALVLECNHDPDMLWSGRYPKPLKDRVAGRFGHLSNADAGRLLTSLDTGRLRHIIAAHLSQDNNRPELAQAALAEALGCAPEDIAVAGRDDGFDWRSL